MFRRKKTFRIRSRSDTGAFTRDYKKDLPFVAADIQEGRRFCCIATIVGEGYLEATVGLRRNFSFQHQRRPGRYHDPGA